MGVRSRTLAEIVGVHRTTGDAVHQLHLMTVIDCRRTWCTLRILAVYTF